MTNELLSDNGRNGSLEASIYQSFQEVAEEVAEPVIKYLRGSDPDGKYYVKIDGQRDYPLGLRSRVIKIKKRLGLFGSSTVAEIERGQANGEGQVFLRTYEDNDLPLSVLSRLVDPEIVNNKFSEAKDRAYAYFK